MLTTKMEVLHPAAKLLVDLSESQDSAGRYGSRTVVTIGSALLTQCVMLLMSGINASVISDALHKTAAKAVEILTAMAVPTKLTDRELLVKCVSTSLNGNVNIQYSRLLAPLAVDAVLSVIGLAKPESVGLRDHIKIVKKLGGTVNDTHFVKGLVVDKKVSSGPTRMEDAKIAVVQFHISPPKTETESIVVSELLKEKEERNYILGMIKTITATGCNVLLIQKRDAANDLSLHYLAKAKIMVIKDVERYETEFFTRTFNCLPIASIEHFRAEKLGHAQLVEEASLGDGGKILKFTGIRGMGRTTSLLVRGSSHLVLDEAERILHDALLCVVRCLMSKSFLTAGGGAPVIELSRQLGAWAKVLHGMESICVKSFAVALEVIPYNTLSENAGLNPIDIVTQLRNKHAQGLINVVQPLLVSTSGILLAIEWVTKILKKLKASTQP